MAKITVLIEGIGLIYEKSNGASPPMDQWKVLFPFDSQHRVNFIWREAGHTNNQSLAIEGGQISISVPNATSIHTPGEGYDSFLDISTEIHESGIKLKEYWQDSGVVLSIPNAKLYCAEMTKSAFFVRDKNGHTPLHTPKSIGYSAKAEIESNGGNVIIEAKNSDGIYFLKKFRAQEMTIKFDNDCPFGPPTETTDFEMLYDVVEDARERRKKFVVERDKKVTLEEKNPLIASEVLSSSLNFNFLKEFLVDILKLAILNTNLGENEEGVPCHIVKSSKSENLS